MRPQGQITRGKTAHNRLRHADNFLLHHCPTLITRRDGAFRQALWVDLGYGATPVTTLESAERLRRLNPHLPVLGVEIDPQRVAAAQTYQDELTQFRLGGFNLPLQTDETVRLIRAFNVLRQYDENTVQNAYATLATYLLPDGLVFEGTSDPFGRIWVAHLLRRVAGVEGLKPEALVFGFRWHGVFNPADFQSILPKNLIHQVQVGEPIYAFFQAWKQAAQATRAVSVWGQRQWFVAAAQHLAQQGYAIYPQPRYLRQGWLLLKQ